MITKVTVTDPEWKKRIGRSQVTFGPFINVLAGPNGSGKSSLMQAIMGSDKKPRRGEKNPCRVESAYPFRIVHIDLITNNPHRGYFDSSTMDMGFQLSAMRSSHGEYSGATIRAIAKMPADEPHVFLIDEPENGLDMIGMVDFTKIAIDCPHQIIVASHHPLVWKLPAAKQIIFGKNRKYIDACLKALAETDELLERVAARMKEAENN